MIGVTRLTPTILCIISFLTSPAGIEAASTPSFKVENEGAFIREWLVCGPFPNGSRKIGSISLEDYVSEGFQRDFLQPIGGEALADPKPGDTIKEGSSGEEHPWVLLSSQEDLISFEKFFPIKDNVVAYAFAHIESPTERETLLSVGSNDGIRIFLNGELVHSHFILRWLGKDTDYVPITLRKGTNRLLIKIDESGGDWGFSARLVDLNDTLRSIRANIDSHKKLRVVTRGDHLVAFFGEPYQIETLNPGALVQVDAFDGDGNLEARLSGKCGKELRFPLSSFEEGPVHFKARFPLGDGNFAESERGHYVGTLPRHDPPPLIRKDLAFECNGQPYLPIGIYSAQPEEYGMLKAAGFNFVVCGVEDLDKVHEAGLMAAIGFHGDDEVYLKHLRETIEKYKNHPAVLCWMLADEPGYNQMDLLNIHKAYQLVHEIDPAHPSYLVITDPRVYKTFGRCCDVLAIDTYPISKKFPINDVGFNISKAYSESDGDLPIWHCGQLFAWPSDRVPTPEENRFMNYLALMDGAKGLLWYGLHWYGTSLPVEAPELWESHLDLIREIQDLERFWIAPGFGTELEVEDSNGGVRADLKETETGDHLIIALNTSTDTSTEARIPVTAKEVEVVGENRRITIENGMLKEHFEPLSVHLYLVR